MHIAYLVKIMFFSFNCIPPLLQHTFQFNMGHEGQFKFKNKSKPVLNILQHLEEKRSNSSRNQKHGICVFNALHKSTGHQSAPY